MDKTITGITPEMVRNIEHKIGVGNFDSWLQDGVLRRVKSKALGGEKELKEDAQEFFEAENIAPTNMKAETLISEFASNQKYKSRAQMEKEKIEAEQAQIKAKIEEQLEKEAKEKEGLQKIENT